VGTCEGFGVGNGVGSGVGAPDGLDVGAGEVVGLSVIAIVKVPFATQK
jgi:hypothetical protein